jgi:hypothetical protein
MGAEGMFPAEMPDDPSSPIDPLDDDTAERLLAGRLDPLDAPGLYAAVSRLLRAAAAPPTPDELAGEPGALAAFRSRQARPRPVPGGRPGAGVGGRSRRRLVAVALAGTLVAGGLWTAQGAALLPGLRSPTGGAVAGGSGSSAHRLGETGSGGSGPQGVGSEALRVAGLDTAGVPGRGSSAVPTGRDRVTGSRRGEAATRGGGSAHGTKPDRPGSRRSPSPSRRSPSPSRRRPRPSRVRPSRVRPRRRRARAPRGTRAPPPTSAT